ncbi:MAG: hypothetical protein ACJATV_001740 [Granulosicoccus sp.]|jgi:hypothetical protein
MKITISHADDVQTIPDIARHDEYDGRRHEKVKQDLVISGTAGYRKKY